MPRPRSGVGMDVGVNWRIKQTRGRPVFVEEGKSRLSQDSPSCSSLSTSEHSGDDFRGETSNVSDIITQIFSL